MTGKKLFGLFSLVLIVAVLLQGCLKFDNLPQLEIHVIDENGTSISGAYVALFDSAEEWSTRKNPVQVWRQTDSGGQVVFFDLKEITYYIYVRFDGKDNSVGGIFTAKVLQVNQRNKVVIGIR
jgi:hypothetical protein